MMREQMIVRCSECLDGLIGLRQSAVAGEMRGDCCACGLVLRVVAGRAIIEPAVLSGERR